ncbi:MAG: PAS domain S-box protein [Leptolyngbyaceae cyanobacterium]
MTSLNNVESAIVRAPLIVSPEAPVGHAIALMSGLHDHCLTTPQTASNDVHLGARSGCVLAVDQGQVVGILTERDVVRLSVQYASLEGLRVGDVMTQPVVAMQQSALGDVFAALGLLQEHKIRHLPVLDDHGQVMGVVTQESLRELVRPMDLLRISRVADVMTTDVMCIGPEQTMAAAAAVMAEACISCVVVASHDADGRRTAVGILTERDLVQFQALELGLQQNQVRSFMSSPVFAVAEADSLLMVQNLMHQRNIRRVVVNGDRGELLGIVTQTSLLQVLNPLDLYNMTEVLTQKVATLEAEKIALLESRAASLESEVRSRTAELKASEQRYRQVVETTLEGVWTLDSEHRTSYANPRMAEILGYEVEDMLGKTVFEFMKAADIPIAQAKLSERQAGVKEAHEFRFQRPDGTLIWTQIAANPLYSPDGQHTGALAMVTDITEQKQADEKLRQSEERYRILVNTAPVGIFHTDADGCCTYINELWSEIAGLTLEEARGYGWSEALHPEDRDRIAAEWYAASQEQRPFKLEYRFQHVKTGKVTWVYGQSVAAEHDQDGNVIAYVGAITDITAGKAAELALQQREAQSQAILAAIPDLMFRVSCSGTYLQYITFSPEIDALNHIDSPVGKTMHEVLPVAVADRHTQAIQRAIATGELQIYEQQIWVNNHLQDEEVRIIQSGEDEVLFIIRNVSERKRIEAERQAAEQRLKESERRFRRALQFAPFPIMIHAEDGEILQTNQAWAQLSGYDSQDLPTVKAWLQLAYGENAEVVYQDRIAQQYELSAAQDEGEFVIKTRDGQQRVWHFSTAPLEELSDGRQVAISMAMDVTDRRQAERELRESENRYRSIFDQAAVGFISAAPDGTILQANPTACQMFGYSPEAMLAKTIADLTHPDDRDRIQPDREKLFAGDWPSFVQEIRYLRHDGSSFWANVDVSPVRDGAGNVSYAMAVIQDISDRKQAEEQLHNLIEATAATTGREFFPALVEHIAKTLEVPYVFLTERIGNQLQVLDIWSDEALQSLFSYAVEGTPCELSLQSGGYFCPDRVQEKFPTDVHLQMLQAESYLGVALKNRQGEAIGNLCIVERGQIKNSAWAEKLLTVFAARAASELERQQAILQLEQLNIELEYRVAQRTAELQQQEERLQDFLDNANDLIQIVQLEDARFEYVNQSWQKALGYSAAELVDLSLFDVLAPECQPHCQAALRQMQAGELQTIPRIELTFITKAGEPVIVEGSINCRIEAGKPTSSRAIFRDETERKRAERELQASQRFIQQIADASPNVLYLHDLVTNQNLYCNRELSQVLGYSAGTVQAMGHSFVEQLMHPDDQPKFQAHTAQLKALTEGEVLEFEYRMRRTDGTWRWFYSRDAAFTYDADGQVRQIIGTAQDISDRKQAEASLQLANAELQRATRLKDEFLANMSHELRTPLNAILGMTESLKEELLGSLNPKQGKAVNTIQQSGSHLLELINDILDIAKISSGEVKIDKAATNIDYICESSEVFIKQQALKKNIQVIVSIEPQLHMLMLDERRIRQALINLLNNAVKFTPEGGKITLTVQWETADTQTGDRYIAVSVADTGIGIGPEDLPKLFQPFVQVDSSLNRQYSGTGLGLSLVKQLVELHGGYVDVTSQLEQGSCFTLYLPIAELDHPPDDAGVEGPGLSQPADAPHDDSQPSQSPPLPAEQLILLVEDNPANVLTTSSYLEAFGYQIAVAKDGFEGVEKAQLLHPDLILMDIQMPGMDGITAIQKIRETATLAHIPIVALTALAMQKDHDRCLAAGATEYISKPVKLRDLRTLVQRLLATPVGNIGKDL